MQLVILDTEYTSWEGSMERGWNGPDEHRELVQISAIKIYDFATLNKTEFFSVYTKPIVNPLLSKYFIELTGITQSKLDGVGLEINEGIKLFSDFVKDCHVLSWGPDIDVINYNCDLLDINIKLEYKKSSDIRDIFNKYDIKTRLYNSGTINSFIDRPTLLIPGRAHNALSDCVSMLCALCKLQETVGEENLLQTIYNLD